MKKNITGTDNNKKRQFSLFNIGTRIIGYITPQADAMRFTKYTEFEFP
jgi:hypothetical protein